MAWMSAALDSLKLGPGDLLVFVSWPTPWVSYHVRLSVFLTVSALRIKLGRSALCQSLVQILRSSVHECQEKLVEQSHTRLCSVRPWCMWSCWNSLHVVHSAECLHVVRLMESHISRNRFRFIWNVSIHS